MNAGAAGNIVENKGHGACVRKRCKPLNQPRLGRSNVVRCRDQQTGKLVLRHGHHPIQRVAQVVTRNSHDQWQAISSLFDQHLQLLLIFAQSHCLAGRATNNEARNALRGKVLHQLLQCQVVNFATKKWSDQGNPEAGKWKIFLHAHILFMRLTDVMNRQQAGDSATEKWGKFLCSSIAHLRTEPQPRSDELWFFGFVHIRRARHCNRWHGSGLAIG